jgi:hypothetical protein
MNVLPVGPDAPWWVADAAKAVLVLHIGGGTLGILSGTVAIIARKGERLHRVAGTLFFGSMLVMSGIGGAVAPFLHDRVSSIAGFLTFYLVATAWMTVRREEGKIGRFEIAALAWVLGVIGVGAILGMMAVKGSRATSDAVPPEGFFAFAIVGALAALGDFRMILRGGTSGIQRVVRHLWRMCTALFVASGSFFLGQQKVMPLALKGSPLLTVLALAPLVLMVFWLIRVRLPSWSRPTSRDREILVPVN